MFHTILNNLYKIQVRIVRDPAQNLKENSQCDWGQIPEINSNTFSMGVVCQGL